MAMFWKQDLKVKVQEAWLYLLRVCDFKSLINSSGVIWRYDITRWALKLQLECLWTCENSTKKVNHTEFILTVNYKSESSLPCWFFIISSTLDKRSDHSVAYSKVEPCGNPRGIDSSFKRVMPRGVAKHQLSSIGGEYYWTAHLTVQRSTLDMSCHNLHDFVADIFRWDIWSFGDVNGGLFRWLVLFCFIVLFYYHFCHTNKIYI